MYVPDRKRIRHLPGKIRLILLGAVIIPALLSAAFSAVAAAPQLAAAWPGATGFERQQLEPTFYALPDNIEILQLENGLQVLLMRNPAQPMVGIYTQVGVGSAYEDFRTSGMSHMLEHLLFNGTEKYTQEQLYRLTDRHGAYNNANTSDFYTNFMTVVSAEDLATGLEIQSQMLFHSLIPADKFEKEKGIVVGELVGNRDTPGYFAAEALREVLYAGSSLALPTLGTKSTIEHMVRDDVYAFYRNYYVPNNMITTLAGNFERDDALKLLEQYFGATAPGTVERPAPRPAPFIDRTRTVVRRGGGERQLVLAFDAPSYQAVDFFPFLVLVQLLDAPASGILTRALDSVAEAERPELSDWWERADGYARLVLQFTLAADVDPASYYRLVQEACAAALDQGISDEDVNEIVSMEETGTLLQREQLRETGIYAAEPLVLGGPDFFVSYLDRLHEVTAEDVALAMSTYLVDTPCLALLIEPEEGAEAAPPAGMQLPEGMQVPPAMLEALKKMQAQTKAQETEKPQIDGGPSPGSMPARPAPAPKVLPVQRTELQNGAVLVSQQNPASPLLAVHLTVRNRAVLDNGRPGSLNLVHRLLLSGVGGCDASCFSRKLRRLGAVVKLVDNPDFPMDDYYTDGRFSFVRVEVSAENGPAVLELLTDITQHASFSRQDFERERREQIALLEKQQDSARIRANQLLAATLFGTHPLARPPEGDVASLQALSYDDVRSLYRKAFQPPNLIIAVVGPVSHEELASQLENLLPGRGQPTNGLPPLPVTREEDRVTQSLGGEMAAMRIGALLDYDPADEKALEILTAILSDRIAMDLRETKGLSYSVGAAVDLHNGQGEFTAWLNPPRERLEEGEAALHGFLRTFDPATITQDELDRIRSARVGRWMLRRLSSMSQAYYLAMAELDGDVTRAMRMLHGYDGISLADLQRVGRTYLAHQPLVTVVVD
jgi:zinc protease